MAAFILAGWKRMIWALECDHGIIKLYSRPLPQYRRFRDWQKRGYILEKGGKPYVKGLII